MPFVSAWLIAAGPFTPLVLLALLAGSGYLGYVLIEDGIKRRSVWRIALGAPIAGLAACIYAGFIFAML